MVASTLQRIPEIDFQVRQPDQGVILFGEQIDSQIDVVGGSGTDQNGRDT